MRRLARLFRIERRGLLIRRPAELIGRLVERRGALVAALLTGELRRGAELDRALAELSRETCRALPHAQLRLQQIANDLRLTRGEGSPSGLRDHGNGHPLGKT